VSPGELAPADDPAGVSLDPASIVAATDAVGDASSEPQPAARRVAPANTRTAAAADSRPERTSTFTIDT
jgi:hypothetical protein